MSKPTKLQKSNTNCLLAKFSLHVHCEFQHLIWICLLRWLIFSVCWRQWNFYYTRPLTLVRLPYNITLPKKKNAEQIQIWQKALYFCIEVSSNKKRPVQTSLNSRLIWSNVAPIKAFYQRTLLDNEPFWKVAWFDERRKCFCAKCSVFLYVNCAVIVFNTCLIVFFFKFLPFRFEQLNFAKPCFRLKWLHIQNCMLRLALFYV